MYTRRNVTNPVGISPGSPKPKNANVTIVFIDDILSWPNRNASGILYDGSFVMKPGSPMIKVYMTAKKQKPGYTSDGDVDELVINQMFEASHPGNSLEIKEFIQNTIGKDLLIMSGDCQGTEFEVFGTPCSPMRMKPTGVQDDTRTGHDMMFEQSLGTGSLPGTYVGAIVEAEPFSASAALALLKANGVQYLLPSDAAGASITVASIDLDHGTTVSVIGSGGVDPSTLANAAGVAATVILKDGTNWVATKDAVIDLQVFKSGATTYLIEKRRS